MHGRWLLSQLLTAPTRRPGQSHVLIPASRTERLVIVHCSSLSRVFSEPMISFECIKPTKETFERLTAPLAAREGGARGRRSQADARSSTSRWCHRAALLVVTRAAPPSRARAGSFDATSWQLGCAHQRGECHVGFFGPMLKLEARWLRPVGSTHLAGCSMRTTQSPSFSRIRTKNCAYSPEAIVLPRHVARPGAIFTAENPGSLVAVSIAGHVPTTSPSLSRTGRLAEIVSEIVSTSRRHTVKGSSPASVGPIHFLALLV